MPDASNSARLLAWRESQARKKREAHAWMLQNLPGCDEFLRDLKAHSVDFSITLMDGPNKLWED